MKSLLEKEYGKGNVRVRSGGGTAYHWMDIEFVNRPAAFDGVGYGQQLDALCQMIEAAGLYVSRFTHDDNTGDSPCISLKMPQREAAQ